MTVKMVLTVLGGLGLFVLGMNMMSEGLQRAAGTIAPDSRALDFQQVYSNPHRHHRYHVGPSSSATTVMVVGFVNAGLMDLSRAVAPYWGQYRHHHYRPDRRL